MPEHPALCLLRGLLREEGSGLLVLAVLDQVVDHRRIGQRGRIAKRAEIVLGDLAEDAPHDLAGARLGEARRELDLVGARQRTDFLPHMRHEVLAEFFRTFLARHQRHVAINALALDVVRVADDGCLGNLRMRDES